MLDASRHSDAGKGAVAKASVSLQVYCKQELQTDLVKVQYLQGGNGVDHGQPVIRFFTAWIALHADAHI